MKTKMFISVIIVFIVTFPYLYGQIDCDKEVSVEKDEYTGKISVKTESLKIMDMTGKHLLNELFNSEDKVADWNLYWKFSESKNTYRIIFSHYSFAKSATGIKYAYLKLENDSVIELIDPFVGDETYTGPKESFVLSIFKLSASDLNKLMEYKIKKIKVSFVYQPREPVCEAVLDEKISLKIKNLATCFYEIAPKHELEEMSVNKSPKSENKQIQNNSENIMATIKPLGNDGAISIFKQWKSIVKLNKDGIPINEDIDITQFFENGTFKSILQKNGKTTNLNGKFSLVSDNKIIVFYLENGETYSLAITKLTDIDLEMKNEDFTILYNVY